VFESASSRFGRRVLKNHAIRLIKLKLAAMTNRFVGSRLVGGRT